MKTGIPKEKWVLIITAIVLLFMLLFPPFVDRSGYNMGYGFIVQLPIYGYKDDSVNTSLLLLQCAIVTVVGVLIHFSIRQT
jgi:hypothetical protein